ncbi:MAG TPA: hypothetical protein VJ779_17230 [Acetobacteraceae bacterium]|nr:hypothetical protein [Acetobacteraceae bacterium]
MQRRSATGLWMGAALCAAVALAALTLAACGIGPTGLRRALEVTARFSFVLFWLAYAGSALAALFGAAFQSLARRGRDLGLAFASAHLVHAGLVVWLFRISPQPPVTGATFAFFTIGLVWVYLLALLSIKRLSGMLGPLRWRILRTVGLEYISLAFLFDFINHPIHLDAKSLLGYVPFATLAVTGTILRIAAWMHRRQPTTARGALPS